MKIIYYMNNLTADSIAAVATSAWSVRKYGCLPKTTKYVLYTDDAINRDNLILNQVFDSIEDKPFDSSILNQVEWDKLLPLPDSYDRDYADQKMFWNKLLSFVHTPCDGSQVVYLDWDTICINRINGIVPPGTKAMAVSQARKNMYSNGVMVKNPIFNTDGYDKIITEPLFDADIFRQVYEIHPSGDEVGTAWLGLHGGPNAIHKLDAGFNYSSSYAVKNNIDVKARGVRILHYVRKEKPWMYPEKMDDPVFSLWWDAKFKMLSEIENG